MHYITQPIRHIQYLNNTLQQLPLIHFRRYARIPQSFKPELDHTIRLSRVRGIEAFAPKPTIRVEYANQTIASKFLKTRTAPNVPASSSPLPKNHVPSTQ